MNMYLNDQKSSQYQKCRMYYLLLSFIVVYCQKITFDI